MRVFVCNDHESHVQRYIVCDQTRREDELERELARMNPKSGFRRWLLDMFYSEQGTRWTWQTAMGLAILVPVRLVSLVIIAVTVVCCLPMFILGWLSFLALSVGDWIGRWLSGLAYSRYCWVMDTIRGIEASGNGKGA